MDIKKLIFIVLLSMFGQLAMAADGFLSRVSGHAVGKTADRLEAALKGAGFRIFARVNHAAGAKSVGMTLAPTELLIFGKPKGGTALMQSARTVGVDLPLKFLVWEDDKGDVMIGWNDPAWVTARHGIADRMPVVKKLTGALRKFAMEAGRP